MTCFFDPAHPPAGAEVLWSPQWGVPRPVQACAACAQRVRSTPPPYYVPSGAAQSGYGQSGYGQSGYGQDQDRYGRPGQGYGQSGHSTAAVVGAGVAGLAAGALLGELLDDEPRVIERTYVYEEDDGFFDF
ncbi:hypothetical protein [Kitasatospora sp. LaBMicrA B282]|uniref:hypothetical protein n=1 Tax=Kitasatospora sp. LaBMicrA B282 TaxID=3420949 RepID=UPI003D0BE804